VHAPSAVVMVRPHRFRPNPETEADNTFQARGDADRSDVISRSAYREVTEAVERLRAHGVDVHLFEDDADATPDSVFPNNWFSTHAGGHVAIYPMYNPSRRLERRWDVIEMLKREYRVQDVIDYSGLAEDGVFLEGTGAMVLDHVSRLAFVCRSNRADPVALERFCTNFGFEPMAFDAIDEDGNTVYHTNVLMCVASDFVLIGSSMIRDEARRAQVLDRLGARGRTVIELSPEQVHDFAGNAIELTGADGRLLAMSARGVASLTDEQRAAIEASCTLVPLDVPTIELAGGSVRCMLAGVHLDMRPAASESAAVA